MPGARKIIKRILLGLLLILLLLIIARWELVSYGFRQAKGQLHIIWNAEPVEEYLQSPTFPDSLKTKLALISKVRQFAIDSLSLKDTKNYKTLYDQKGEEVMWVVMASEPFQLKAKEWDFPVIGSVPYKGFFDREEAIKLRNELEKEGWEVNIRNPGGWSTLGWFTDPILSKMLERSEGDLANLIIHEMAHATIFVKDSIDFNENLATFIGDRGAEQFLLSAYGPASDEYTTYMNEDRDYLLFSDHMLRGSERLDSLYKTMNENDPVEKKIRLKRAMIQKIVQSLDTIPFSANTPKPSLRFSETLPNNAYFLNFIRYQSKQDVFMEEWRRQFNGNLKAYIEYLSDKYPFL
ncbi:MAG TPA: aminopeptidase [Chryseosolibacter sp.]|nr:aminopeptidase [Chryseosolibacter sp.]